MGASASVGKDGVDNINDEHIEEFNLDENNTVIHPKERSLTHIRFEHLFLRIIIYSSAYGQVDMFAKEVYARSPKVEGLAKILDSRTGRQAYMKFLRSEYADEQLWFFMVS
jgi:hypothetical protein